MRPEMTGNEHPVDAYTSAAAFARRETINEFGVASWPPAPGSDANNFSNERVDEVMRDWMDRSNKEVLPNGEEKDYQNE